MEARDLPVMNLTGSSDPYAVINVNQFSYINRIVSKIFFIMVKIIN